MDDTRYEPVSYKILLRPNAGKIEKVTPSSSMCSIKGSVVANYSLTIKPIRKFDDKKETNHGINIRKYKIIFTGKYSSKLMRSSNEQNTEKFYHGTKAGLAEEDLIAPGFNSNYGQRSKANYVYLTATLEAAIWGAELAVGEGAGRIYIVEPLGSFEDDPNLTDKKFPGNPTKSYRTRSPLRIIGEITDWQGHSPEQLKTMNDHLKRLKEQGIEAIND